MKKVITLLSCAVLLAAVFTGCTGGNNNPSAVSENTTEAKTAETTTAQTTVITTQAEQTTVEEESSVPSTAQEKTESPNTFMYKGAWYLYDEENRVAYAFRFDGRKVRIAFFDNDNIEGLDAKFFTAKEEYTDSGDRISFEDPMNLSRPFELTVKDKKLYFNGKALSHEKESSLEIAFNHFNS